MPVVPERTWQYSDSTTEGRKPIAIAKAKEKPCIARYRAKQQTQRGIGVPGKAKSGGFRLSGRSGGSGVGLRLGVLGQAPVDR